MYLNLVRMAIACCAAISLTIVASTTVFGSDAGAHPSKIKIDTSTLTSPALVGRIDGIFDADFSKIGVTVSYTELTTTSQMLEGHVSNNAGIVELGYVGVATGAAARVPFTVIGTASNGGGDVLLVHKGSTIKSVADLKGKTVAFTKGSSSWALLLDVLDKAGISSTQLNFVNSRFDEGQNAFLSDQVDTWAVWSGSKTDAVNQDNSVALTSATDIGLIPGMIAVRSSLLQKNPTLVVTYLRARQQAFDLLNHQTAPTVAAIGVVRNVPSARVDLFLKISVPANATVTDHEITDLQGRADLPSSLGEVKRRVDILGLVNNRFIEEATATK